MNIKTMTKNARGGYGDGARPDQFSEQQNLSVRTRVLMCILCIRIAHTNTHRQTDRQTQ